MTTGMEALDGRVSTKRLRAEITRVNEARKNGVGMPVYPGPFPACDWGSDEGRKIVQDHSDKVRAYHKAMEGVSAKRATLLYSLRSHLRGRLHITHQYVQQPGPLGLYKVESRTMNDQAALVAPLWTEFAMTDEEAKLDAELRAKRIAMFGQCNAGPTPQDPIADCGCQS